MGHIKDIRAIDDLTPDPNNINQGTERGAHMLTASLERLGAGRSILVSAEGTIIAGNKTLGEWETVGQRIKVVQTDGHELVVVQRTDVHDGDPKFTQLAVADNRVSEIDYMPDAQKLLAASKLVDIKAWYTDEEIEMLELLSHAKPLPESAGEGMARLTIKVANQADLDTIQTAVEKLIAMNGWEATVG